MTSSSDQQSPEEQFELLAALHAAGGLGGPDLRKYESMLAELSGEDRQTVKEFEGVSSLLAMAAPVDAKVDPRIKEQLFEKLDKLDGLAEDGSPGDETETPDSKAGNIPDFLFTGTDEGEWRPLPVKGARIKELTNDRRSPYVVFLLDLKPGVSFPGHRHHGAEDTYLISGDLHIQGRAMGPGDHLRSEPGTKHSRSHTVSGCRALIITARENYHSKSIRAYGLVHKAVSKVTGIFKPGDN